MSLTNPDAPRAEVVLTALGETCFYCGRPMRDPAITWHGATGEVWLHPICAADLCIRLFRDVWECRHGGSLVSAGDTRRTQR